MPDAQTIYELQVYGVIAHRSVFAVCMTFVIVTLACFTGMTLLVNGRPASPPIKLSGSTACVSIPSPASDRSAIVLYSLLLYNAAFTMLMSLWYGVKLFWSVQPAPSASLLVRIFYVDGALYFAAITGISIANIVVSLHAPYQYRLTLAIPQIVVHAVLASRMVLHLREVARVQLVEPDVSVRLGERVEGSKPWGVTGTLSAFRATSDAGRED
ncbi:hypothetical protein BKA70DRAFT_1559517 [Coprinopsis sp. MPI-PUGE-AT-0042]|nr:hypothetical protein BKA70DRAFT_1559517 [Coprinopsis sp. MPI-PUGE-AT-0042]